MDTSSIANQTPATNPALDLLTSAFSFQVIPDPTDGTHDVSFKKWRLEKRGVEEPMTTLVMTVQLDEEAYTREVPFAQCAVNPTTQNVFYPIQSFVETIAHILYPALNVSTPAGIAELLTKMTTETHKVRVFTEHGVSTKGNPYIRYEFNPRRFPVQKALDAVANLTDIL